MGLFDGISSAVSSAVSSATSSVSTAVGFAVSSAETKLAESVTKTSSTLGSASGITKLTAGSTTIASQSAAALAAAGGIAAGKAADATTGSVSASTVNSATGAATTSKHFVTLTSNDTPYDSKDITQVVFTVMPQLVESHQVEYEGIAPSQFPGAFQKYKGTAAVVWTLNATFIARTSSEAEQNKNYLNALRGWTEPYFGSESGGQYPGYLGSPPPVLDLFGFRGLIGTVPVVITSLNWDWPKDVDWLPTKTLSEFDNNFVPFPSVLNVAINMVESYSINQFNSFSLADFRAGNMTVAFMDTTSSGMTATTTDSTSTSAAAATDPALEGDPAATTPTDADRAAADQAAAIADQEKGLALEQKNIDDAQALLTQSASVINASQAAILNKIISDNQGYQAKRQANIAAIQAGQPIPNP